LNPDDNTVILTVPGKTSRTFRTGDVVGDNYCLLELIGQGGMGVVYRCRHQIIGHEYALKVLRPDQVNEQSWQRFQLEGRAIAKLDHPNIVKIFNMGIDSEDCPYYVMELLSGLPLEAYTEADKPLSLDEKLDIFGQLAAALSYAHSKDIIHRDIKPANIILEKNLPGKYNVKIVDFGLAKLVNKHMFAKQSLTSEGEVFGSPFYMSPEQSEGAEIDARADIYSLGCTFFKTLTGRPPFEGDTAFQTIFMHQNRRCPSLASVNTGEVFPEALEHLVQKMLAKRPSDRYQSMAQVSHDIERLQEGKSLEKKTPTENIASEGEGAVGQHRETSIKAYLLPVIITVAVIFTVGGFVFVSELHKRPPPAATVDSKVTSPLDTNMWNSTKSVADITMDKANEDFKAFIPSPTVISQTNGKKWLRFYFPDTGVGDLDTYGASVPAVGIRVLAVHGFITLVIHRGKDRYTWAYPWILKKVDSVNINDLAINEQEDWEGPSSPGASNDLNDKPVLEMLAIARHWKHFEGFELYDFPISVALLEAIKTIPSLKRLTITHSRLNGAALASCACLQQLERLDVTSIKEVDPLLLAIAGSKKLRSLTIGNTKPSPSAIRALKTCRSLAYFSMQRSDLSDAQLVAVSELPHLREVWLEDVDLDPKRLVQFKAFKSLEGLFVTSQHWSPAEIAMVKNELPNCAIARGDAKITGLE
jgi:serine/threonine protein kinase